MTRLLEVDENAHKSMAAVAAMLSAVSKKGVDFVVTNDDDLGYTTIYAYMPYGSVWYGDVLRVVFPDTFVAIEQADTLDDLCAIVKSIMVDFPQVW